MKKLFFAALLINLSQLLIAQETAITERGDTVLLYSTGEWVYLDNFLHTKEEQFEIKMNDNIYQIPASSNKKVMGLNDAYSISYNDKLWSRIPPGQLNPEADIAFKLKNGDLYSMVIFEEMSINIENLYQISYNNAASVMSDIKMVDKDYRVVNNDTLIWMQMDGNTQGMNITYSSYYLSSPYGSIQFHTFTGQNLFDKYKTELFDLLNGIQLKN